MSKAETEGNGGSGIRLAGVGLWVAVAVLVAFGLFTAFMIANTGEEEVRWTRLAWLFSSIQAIAFGAAGAVFGSSIQRERAEKAEAAAERNAESASKGRALAAALKADRQAGGEPGLTPRGLGGEGAGASASIIERHAALAAELFPD